MPAVRQGVLFTTNRCGCHQTETFLKAVKRCEDRERIRHVNIAAQRGCIAHRNRIVSSLTSGEKQDLDNFRKKSTSGFDLELSAAPKVKCDDGDDAFLIVVLLLND